MPPRRYFAIPLILLMTGWACIAGRAQTKPAGQVDDSKKPPTEKAPVLSDKETGRNQIYIRIIFLLQSIADKSVEWSNVSLAAKAQAEVADLTWDADPLIARKYLLKAWDTAIGIKEENDQVSRFRNHSSKTDVQQVVMFVARKRAPELVKKWLEEMAGAENSSSSPQQRGMFDDRSARSTVLLQMASQTLQDDPKSAAQLAIESLNDGVSFGLQSFLIALQQVDFSLAETVFRAALSHLRTAGMRDPNELLILSSYLYTPGRVRGGAGASSRGGFSLSVGRDAVTITSASQLDPQLSSDFLSLAANLLTNAPLPSASEDPVTAARTQVGAIDSLIGRISEAFPDLGQALQNRLQQIALDAKYPQPAVNGPAAPQLVNEGESRSGFADKQSAGLLQSARDESNPLTRDILYAKAALATSPQKYETGWSIAQNIQDKDLQQPVKDLISYRGAISLIKQNDLEAAHRVCAKDADPLQRGAALVLGAQSLAASGDNIRAGEWLQEATSLVGKAKPEQSSIKILLGATAVYAKFDQLMAEQTFSRAVKLMDQLHSVPAGDERAPLVQRVSGLSFPDFTYATSGFGLNSALSTFPPEAFEDLETIINGMVGSESRGLSLILLCRKYLPTVSPDLGRAAKR